MSRTLKWVLGILAVLVVVAIVGGGVWVFMHRGQMMASVRPYAAQPKSQATPGVPNGPNFPYGPRGFDNNGRNPMGGYGFRGPMMGGRGRFSGFGPFGMGFFFLGGLFRLIIPLGLLVLFAVLFYELGKRAGRASVLPAHPASAPGESAAPGSDLPKSS